MTVTVIHGDCTEVLPTLAAGSVQCCVTSPPYFGLRAYPHAPTAWPAITVVPVAGLPALTVPAQVCHLGAEADPWAYVAHLVHVFRAVWRVLRDDGTLWLNLGDSYAARRTYQVPPTQWPTLPVGGSNAGPLPPGLKAKDLMLIPSRVALALQADGWWLRNDVIWEKPNAMPESVQDRLTTSYEHILVFAKRARYYYDAEAIAEPATGGHRGSRFSTGKTRAAREQVGAPVGQRTRVDRATRNARDVWQISTRSYHGAHFAVFPDDLPARCIRAGTPPQACDQCGAPWQRTTTRARATYPQQDDPTPITGRRGWNRPRPGPSDQVVLAIAQPDLAARLRQAATGREREMQERFGSKWDHWLRTDSSGARIPTAADAAALADLLGIEIPDDGHAGDWQPTCACAANPGTGRSLVLDPFGGSGTTSAVAERLGRDSILIEAAADYLPLIAQRTDQRPGPQRPPPPPPRRERPEEVPQ
jgi:DNA modification methylase